MSTLLVMMLASNAIHGIVSAVINKNEAAMTRGFTDKIFMTLLLMYAAVIILNLFDKFIYGAFKTREINEQHIKILKRVTGSKMSDIQKVSSGKIFDTTKDIAATMAMLKSSIAVLVYSAIPFTYLIGREFTAAPAAAIISLVSIPLSVGLILTIERKLNFTEEEKKKKSIMVGICADNFVNIRTIKCLGIGNYAVSRLEKAQDDAWRLSINPKKVMFFRLIDVICMAPMLINMFILRHDIEALALIVVSDYAISNFRFALIDIGENLIQLRASKTILKDLTGDDTSTRSNPEDIILDGVKFNYGKDSVEFDIPHLEIPKGSKTMIVGESGEGKSSLANLLAGAIEPESGEVPAYDTYYIWQETESLDDTLWNNIVFDNKYNVSESDVLKYFEELKLLEWYKSLKNGFNTNIGERGCKLSSGQKQRINIIRALIEMQYNPGRLFILDEITSNLDDETRLDALKLFQKVMHDDTTVLFITHNSGFDRICDNKICVKDHIFYQ